MSRFASIALGRLSHARDVASADPARPGDDPEQLILPF